VIQHAVTLIENDEYNPEKDDGALGALMGHFRVQALARLAQRMIESLPTVS